MKRRNAECGKLRRPIKRNKITEGIYGSTFLYLKFLLVWSLVLMADFIVEFRFEYLWPFWLLLRSVYDSFKYQGLAFSVFFVCIAITSDVVCYLFIPVQWLFFAASTYVWVQYVWHTDRGICLPTVSLWLLFVYVEASIRLRDFKSPAIYMDLGRPFAAHCIGYPVVTLGFGFKSYVCYRLRLRKQKEVEKENEFYIQLLQQALPAELQTSTQNDKHKALPSRSSSHEETISNGSIAVSTTSSTAAASTTQTTSSISTPITSTTTSSGGGGVSHSKKPSVTVSSKQLNTDADLNTNKCSTTTTSHKDLKKQNNMTGDPSTGGGTPHIEDLIEHSLSTGKKSGGSVNTYDEENMTNDSHVSKTYNKTTSVGSTSKSSDAKLNKQNSSMTSAGVNKRGSKATNSASGFTNIRDESYIRLEADMKRVKSDLISCRNSEQELRSQISSQLVEEKATKVELYQLRDNNESLQTRLHNLVTSRQQDKQTIASLERKLAEERKTRTQYEQQITTLEKKKKDEAAAAASIRAAAASNSNREECSASCKARRREIETELKQKRVELMLYEEQIRQKDRENQSLMQYKDAHADTEVLMSALQAMQEKTAHLETSLSAETRLKLDLFSALGDAKRQIEIQQGLLMQKDAQIAEFKSKIAEVMAVMPASSSPFSAPSPSVSTEVCAPHFSAGFTTQTPPHHHSPSPRLSMVCPVTPPPADELLVKSSLNPNASDYTPKMTQ